MFPKSNAKKNGVIPLKPALFMSAPAFNKHSMILKFDGEQQHNINGVKLTIKPATFLYTRRIRGNINT